MFSFNELGFDPDAFYSKSEDIKALSIIEKFISGIQEKPIELSSSEAAEFLISNHTCHYVFAKTLFKFCLFRPKNIEKYLMFLHEVNNKEPSLFRLFRRIFIIEYKSQEECKEKSPEIIFILNKLIEMKDLTPDDLIHSQIGEYPQLVHYFDNSQNKHKSHRAFECINMKELEKDNWSLHLDLLSKGHHHLQAFRSIEIDDVDTIISLAGQNSLTINGCVPYSIYKRFSLPFDSITLIEYAAFFGSIECFKFLLLNNAKFNDRLALLAVCSGNAEIIHICEQNNLKFTGGVKLALKYHHIEIFQWLIENNKEKFPPMNEFFEMCIKYSCFSLLIDYLPNCTQINELNLMAIYHGNNLLHSFLKQFKEIHYDNLLNAIEMTCINGNYELFKFFNRNKFTKNQLSNSYLLHKATFSESEDIVQLLLTRKGIDINQPNKSEGYTPFHLACNNSSNEVARILMNHYCDLNIKSAESGYTGLHFACENGNKKIVSIILEQPNLMIDVTDNINFETALHVAAKRGFHEIVQMLLVKGFYINELSKYNMRPLHLACMNGNILTVKTLISFDPVNINLNSGTILNL